MRDDQTRCSIVASRLSKPDVCKIHNSTGVSVRHDTRRHVIQTYGPAPAAATFAKSPNQTPHLGPRSHPNLRMAPVLPKDQSPNRCLYSLSTRCRPAVDDIRQCRTSNTVLYNRALQPWAAIRERDGILYISFSLVVTILGVALKVQATVNADESVV